MNAVDTNILIYLNDPRDPVKQGIAISLVSALTEGVLLWQVACEYLAASRKLCASLHLEMSRWSHALIAFTKSGGYRSFKKELAQIKQPTLILWGKEDRILGTTDAYRFKRVLAHSKLIWIKDCGHVPHLEQPKITAGHILDFRLATIP
jgi:pimeloyl-ACP methyl ester carboxylesterase